MFIIIRDSYSAGLLNKTNGRLLEGIIVFGNYSMNLFLVHIKSNGILEFLNVEYTFGIRKKRIKCYKKFMDAYNN